MLLSMPEEFIRYCRSRWYIVSRTRIDDLKKSIYHKYILCHYKCTLNVNLFLYHSKYLSKKILRTQNVSQYNIFNTFLWFFFFLFKLCGCQTWVYFEERWFIFLREFLKWMTITEPQKCSFCISGKNRMQ